MGRALLSRCGIFAVALALLPSGCLRGNQSASCDVLEDCLCGGSVGRDRSACLGGTNRLALVLEDAATALSDDQCQVVLHQEGAGCPSGDLSVRAMDPSPARRCVHDNDCDRTPCSCDGSAAVEVDLPQCIDGVCVDAVRECRARCLRSRVVRGDSCNMLRRCRCAPLLAEPDRDDDGNNVADLAQCLARFSTSDQDTCQAAAESSIPVGDGATLPTEPCPDAATFLQDP